jgi:Ca2+-transporting ATPase
MSRAFNSRARRKLTSGKSISTATSGRRDRSPFTGLLTAAGTLGVISWAGHGNGLAVARTMGMVTFALFSLFFSIECKDERDSAFSLETFSGMTFLITTSVSFILLVLSTVLGIFQNVMGTTRLDVPQWLICTAVALSVVAATEISKAVRRRTATTRANLPT